MPNKGLSDFKIEEKILLASYVLIAIAYGTMFYIKWKALKKQSK